MAADFRITTSLWAMVVLLLHCTNAFYIPGWSIKSWKDGEIVPLFVNKIYSDNTQLSYAYSELPFVCPPSGRPRHGTGLISGSNVALNLGEVLRGDRIMVSDYELEMGKDDVVHYLCSQKVDRAGLKKAKEIVKKGYVAEWIVDNLPGATKFMSVDKSRTYYASGFKMGYEDLSPTTGQPRYFINNHVTIAIKWHAAPGRAGQRGEKVIVGFEVFTKSIEASNRDENGLPAELHNVHGMELAMTNNVTNATLPRNAGPAYLPEEVDDDATLTIPYTYSVYFREDPHVEWANRWDLYFVNQDETTATHWLAIVNSLVIFAVLSSVVAVIFARTIRGEILGYSKDGLEEGKLRIGKRGGKSPRSPRKSGEKGGGLLEPVDRDATDDTGSDDEILEDMTGWKLVHGDVFRTPAYGHLLAPLIGSGLQLLFVSASLLVLSVFGVLNPSFRGGYISVGFALFIFAGAFSGYFSARLYKTFNGTDWRANAILTATLIPGLLFATTLILNLFVWANASSTAIPLGTLLALLILWLAVQLPLVYISSWYGFLKSGSYSHPIRANPIPRQIPQQPWYLRPLPAAFFSGSIPFAVIVIELYFVFHSLWADKSSSYYLPGFLFLISTILSLTVALTTIISVYFQLCCENWHWWTTSFASGASSAAWVFLYSAYYFHAHLHIEGFVNTLLFFSYAGLACCGYGVLMGTVGFCTAYAFVRRIYGAIKVD